MTDSRPHVGRPGLPQAQMHAPVTGASGFIDGRLSRGLCERGDDVRCLVRDGESISARALAEEGFELHVGDVLRPNSLSNVGRGVDVATTWCTPWIAAATAPIRRARTEGRRGVRADSQA